MNDTGLAKLPARFSALFLGGVTAWLLILYPAQLAPGEPYASLLLFGTLAGIFTLYLTSWKNHIIPYSIVACILFIISDRRTSESPMEAAWQLNQVFFFGAVGLHLIAWSELDKRLFSGIFWLLMAFGAVALTALMWIEAEQTGRYLAAHPNEGWTTSNQRIRICSFVMLMLGGLMAARLAKTNRQAAWLWLAIGVFAPIVGFGVARLYAPVEIDQVLAGAQLNRSFADLVAWMGQADVIDSCADWCWTTPGIVLPLMFIGLWRTVARGYRQKKKGMMPYAWIISVAAYLLLAAVLPATSEGYRPIGLIWLGVALSVFAVADLGMLLFEQVALPVPDSKPAPHV